MLIKPKSVWGFPKHGFAHQQEQTTCQRGGNAAAQAQAGREIGSARFKSGSAPCSAKQKAGPSSTVAPARHTEPSATRELPCRGLVELKTCHGRDTCTWLSDTAAVHFGPCSAANGRRQGACAILCSHFCQNVPWESTQDYEQSCCHDVSNGRHGFVYGQCLLRTGAAQAPCEGPSPCAPPRPASPHQALIGCSRWRSLILGCATEQRARATQPPSPTPPA